MELPDRAEQVGIVVGSALVVALPTGHLGSIIGIEIGSWLSVLLFFVPGLVIGGLIVTDRLPATYVQVWAFSLVSWILTAAGWRAFGVQFPIPASERPIALGVWIAAIVVGSLYAWARPVSVAKRRLLAG
jgi:hypothetical protein